ncbi:MAG: ATP-binding protein [Alicyclobacillus sp.]|nr:ATP-binding protein [Alicyclobacillus sp.]
MAKVLELVVISGKGGTGKTTLVAALAMLLGPLVLADYDVDAANLHLVVGARRLDGGPFRAGWEPLIDAASCTECGRYTDACRLGALRDGRIVAPFACEGCGACAVVCPMGAIAMVERRAGEWIVSKTQYGPLVHAELGPGRENSGKLVAKVKEEARRIAAAEERPLILSDGPPGIGCAAIAAISGADAVLIVAEPSLSGRHDLERVLALCRRFRLLPLVCVNKFDLWPAGTEAIGAFCAERDVEMLGRIPWDESVLLAARQGTDVTKTGSTRVRRAVQKLARSLRERLGLG